METQNIYSISDLGKILNVPRTTLNDWLSRYGQFISCEIRGKRRVFPENSLTILKEISELRTVGKNSFEIEQFLATRHPLQAEAISAAGNTAEYEDEYDDETPPQSNDNLAPVVRRQSEEIAGMLGQKLQTLADNLEKAEKLHRKSASLSSRWFVMSFALLLLLVLFAVGATLLVSRMADNIKNVETQKLSVAGEREKFLVEKNLSNAELAHQKVMLVEREKEIARISAAADRNTQEYQENLTRLRDEMKQQEQEFKKMLKNTEVEMEKVRNEAGKNQDGLTKNKNAEIARLKEEFAAEKLALLKKLELESRNTAQKDSTIEKLQQQIIEQTVTIKNMSEQSVGNTQEISIPGKRSK